MHWCTDHMIFVQIYCRQRRKKLMMIMKPSCRLLDILSSFVLIYLLKVDLVKLSLSNGQMHVQIHYCLSFFRISSSCWFRVGCTALENCYIRLPETRLCSGSMIIFAGKSWLLRCLQKEGLIFDLAFMSTIAISQEKGRYKGLNMCLVSSLPLQLSLHSFHSRLCRKISKVLQIWTV